MDFYAIIDFKSIYLDIKKIFLDLLIQKRKLTRIFNNFK